MTDDEAKLKKLPEKKDRISTDVILTKKTIDHLFDARAEKDFGEDGVALKD